MTKPLVLIGGGGHCLSCIDVIEQYGEYHVVGIIDTSQRKGELIMGYPIIADDNQIPELARTYQDYFISLGQIKDPGKRVRLYSTLEELDVNLPTIISPFAYVSKNSRVGQGSIVMHHGLVNSGAVVGLNCIVNTRALVEHGAVIGDHCHVSTGAIVNGDAVIENRCFIGSGAVIREGVRIGPSCIISAGAKVMHDIKAGTVFK